jgi:anhydro-N-acetylmuramic acid kinase
VALGGQGAPLVPMGEKWLFVAYAGFMNLGGFSNVTQRIEEEDGSETMIAYDVCALNIVLNKLCGELNLPFDAEGKIAARGSISSDLLIALNEIKYFQSGKKGSLGLEWVEKDVLPVIEQYRETKSLSIETIIATFTEHCAIQCSNAMPDGRYLLSGGGTHNITLIDSIRKHSNAQIEVPNKLLNDFKEAIIFAFLAGLRASELPNTLTSVTGASRSGSNGAYYKA